MPNRLQHETSPYLLQHQDNPVDWFPWGQEAFEKARAEDKPILLSVGYSACHWCHVMAHESFEDETTAKLMNDLFINIKVDREERPDVDSIYMNAVQAMTGSGGWPMTVVMTHEGKPFFGGTYFPLDDHFGRPSFKRVLLGLAEAWKNQRSEIEESADTVKQYLQRLVNLSDTGELSADILSEALAHLSKTFDTRYGGFGSAPKFPPHSALRWLLRQKDDISRNMAYTTLDHMALGGIYDQIGGGFARYSVDAIWLVPHFEKMLYDNAQLVRRYTEAYAQTQNALYKKVIAETLAFVLRELTSPEGGFYSALDADSEGEEGKFYVWDEEEIDDALGENAALAKRYFGVSKTGNFEGKTILERSYPEAAIREQFGLSQDDLEKKLTHIKAILLEARARRIRPGLDDKILTSWNGLMLAAFADAGRILKCKDYIEVAKRNAQFLRANTCKDGRLLHSYKHGIAKIPGLLEDYAYLGLGLLSLYRTTLDSQWMVWALELAEVIIQHFADANGGFFSTADDAEALIIRPKNYFDSPMPSENAATAEFLLTLSRYTGNASWESLVVKTLRSMTEAMRKQPNGFASLLCVLEILLKPSKEIAVFASGEEAEGFLKVIENQRLQDVCIALVEHEDNPLIAKCPFLQQRGRIDGKATVYVCESGVCKLPVTTTEALRQLLT
jgi:uncharacterized protein YyaL (SSP411 family)